MLMLFLIHILFNLSFAYRLEVKDIPEGFTVEVDNSSLLSQAFIYHGSRFATSIRIINKSLYIESNAKVDKIGLESGQVIGTYEHWPVDPRDWAAVLIGNLVKIFIQPTTTETFNSRMIELLRAIPKGKRSFSTSIITSFDANFKDEVNVVRGDSREFVWRRKWDHYLMGRAYLVGNHIFMDGEADMEFYIFKDSQWSYYNGRYPVAASLVNAVAAVHNPKKLDLDEITTHLFNIQNRPDIKTYILGLSPSNAPSNEGQLIDLLDQLPPSDVDFSARQVVKRIQNVFSRQHLVTLTGRNFTWKWIHGEIFGRMKLISNFIIFECGVDVKFYYNEGHGWKSAEPNQPLDCEFITQVVFVHNPYQLDFSFDDLESGRNKDIETVLLELN